METKINIMGSEVEEGFVCKPKKLNQNRAIMHFKTHIFICEGDRCKGANKNLDLVYNLREIVKKQNLHIGKNRIKISRSGCYGACRFRGVANIYENTNSNGCLQNNNVWLKNIHNFDDKKWIKLFLKLSENKKLDDFESIEMAVVN